MKWYEFVLLGIIFGSALYLWYQIYKIVEIDARSRGLKQPKFWGIFAGNQSKGSGLILYLIGRRKYISNITESDFEIIEKRKKKASLSLGILIVFGIVIFGSLIVKG